ncbi:hypothetical protein [Francisella frigiditurris]|uniref:ParB-like nuclease domain protein n=1 Tax=Francisella frigiditurris TaxID=1542390 RepID=A0A1J0KRS9_9GAMM|nr:hypothetical protein [Francisella frigiditurris]APC96402.1 hypothetical protein KX01_1857 [Francisella frigiditurris]
MNLRKQYHFRKSEKGDLLVWDVLKLIEKAKDLIPKLISISLIKEIDENYWYEIGDSEPTCASLIEHIKLINDANLDYPIILSKDGRVMDGMHRVCKAIILGEKEIKVFQFKEDIPPDYINIDINELQYD